MSEKQFLGLDRKGKERKGKERGMWVGIFG
jgi:hypothetical protein